MSLTAGPDRLLTLGPCLPIPSVHAVWARRKRAGSSSSLCPVVMTTATDTLTTSKGSTARLSWVSWWGLSGVFFLLGGAITRLSPLVVDAFADHSLSWYHWAFLLPWLGFMGYSEGYRGFQLGYSPRVVARALALRDTRHPGLVVAAPIVVLGYVYGTRKRVIVAWSVTLAVVGLVLIVRQLAQPWRGLVDLGVILGLAWGLLCVVWNILRVLRGEPLEGVDAGMPASHRY